MFAKDRDLLILEPALFRDLAWAGQRLVKGVATIDGNSLTFDERDLPCDLASVSPGHVVTVAGVGYEIVEVLGDALLTISRVRTADSDDWLLPTPATAQPAYVATFDPQLRIAHAQILRMLDLAPGPTDASAPGEGAITNPRNLTLLESLATLHLIYSAAAAVAGADSPADRRASRYRARFNDERARTTILLDLDNDGLADASRSLGSFSLRRA